MIEFLQPMFVLPYPLLYHSVSPQSTKNRIRQIFVRFGPVGLGCFPKSTKKNFFQLKHYSDRVLSLDSEYMTQSGQIGR